MIKGKRIFKTRTPKKGVFKGVSTVKGMLESAEVVDNNDHDDIPLTLKQELFCQYYVKNQITRGNATWSYAYAYDYPLFEQSKEDAIYEINKDGTKGKCIKPSSFTAMESVCAVGGTQNLRKYKIQRRNIEIFNSLLKNDIVDAKLVEHILCDDRVASMKAIGEYNKLNGRLIDKVDLTSGGKPYNFSSNLEA